MSVAKRNGRPPEPKTKKSEELFVIEKIVKMSTMTPAAIAARLHGLGYRIARRREVV